VNINELVKAAHQNAIDKGWYEEPRTFGESIALMHSELSEALEDYRSGKGFNEVWYEYNHPTYKTPFTELTPTIEINGKILIGKPCGIPSELADTVIRIFDACGDLGINLQAAIDGKMRYNATRPVRHGGKVL
jgi:hypothetical protein